MILWSSNRLSNVLCRNINFQTVMNQELRAAKNGFTFIQLHLFGIHRISESEHSEYSADWLVIWIETFWIMTSRLALQNSFYCRSLSELVSGLLLARYASIPSLYRAPSGNYPNYSPHDSFESISCWVSSRVRVICEYHSSDDRFDSSASA